MSVDLPALHGDIRAALNILLALPPGGFAVESDAGISEANSAATNKTNYNAWSAANVGKPLFIREGTYPFDAGLAPKGPLYGAGKGITVLEFPEASVSNLYVTGCDNITIADLSIVSTSTATPFAVGINDADSNHITLDGVDRFVVRDVVLDGGANIGLMIYGSSYGSVYGCEVTGTTRDGIHVTQGSKRVTIFGNNVWDTGDDCIAVIAYNGSGVRPEFITVANNTCSNIRARGITVEGGKDVTVTGNVISGTASNGILINSIGSVTTDDFGTTNCTVSGNTINDAGEDGIHVNGLTTSVNICNNTVVGSASAGIRVLMGRVKITGNVVDDSGDMGITIDSTAPSDLVSAESVISDNLVRRAYTRGIFVGEIAKVSICNNVVQEPSQDGVARAAIRYVSGTDVMVVGNRVDATNSTVTPTAVEVHSCTGGLVALNYGTNVTTTVSTTGSTGLVTA